jgi:hypothetical protein
MATINGTFNSLIAGTLSGTVATPGATGPAGPAGPAGSQGIPGVGVPVGGTAGQVLAKVDGVNYNTEWIDQSAPDFISSVSAPLAVTSGNLTVNLAGYATETFVTSQGYITSAALVPYLTKADNLGSLTNFATARDNLNLGTLNNPTFAGLTLQGSGANVGQYTPTSLSLTHTTLGSFVISPSSGITFPDTSIQTTAFVAGSGLPTGGTVGQVLTKNSGSNFDASFATLIPGDRYLTTSTTSLTINNDNKTLTVGTGLSYTPQQDVVIAYNAANHMHAQVLTYNSGTGVMTVDVRSHSGSGTFTFWTVNVGGTVPEASVAWGSVTGVLGNQVDLASALNSKLEVTTAASTYQTLSGMSSYLTTSAAASTYLTQANAASTYFTVASAAGKANLSGATFTGKVNFTPVSGVAGLNVGIGGTSAASSTNGDLWISTGGTNLNFRDGTGSWRILVNTSNTNTFSAPQIIDTTSTTTALRVTQKGTGDAIRVEDDTTPDVTRFAVDQFGKVGIGIAPDATAALKVDTNGIMFGDDTVQTTAAVPFFYYSEFQKASLTDGSSFSVQISPTRVDLLPDVGGGTSLTASGITFPDNTTQTTAAVPGIPDAPNDGYFYVRGNGGWSSPYTTATITVDGNTYSILTLANP